MRCREEEKIIPLVRTPFNWVRDELGSYHYTSFAPPSLHEIIVLLSQREKQELSISEGEL